MPAARFARLNLLRDHPAFARLALAITVSSLGDPLTQIAALVTIYAVTASPLAVAAAFILQALAALLMSTLFGGLADRLSRRSLIVRLGLIRAIILLTTPFLIFLSLWLILPILFLLAFINAIVAPAQQAAVPSLVPAGRVGPANSIVSALAWMAQAFGAALSGFILLFWSHLGFAFSLGPLHLVNLPSTTGLFLIDGLTFFFAALLVRPLPSLGGGLPGVRLSAATRTAFSLLGARSHLLLAAGASFVLGLAFPTFIVLAYRLVGPLQGGLAYSWLEAVTSLSVFAGALLLGYFRVIGGHRTAAFGLALGGLFSLPIFLLGFFPLGWLPFIFALILLFVAGIGNPIYTVANSTALLELASEQNQGSVMATRFGLTQTLSLIGIACAGLLNSLLGPFTTFGFIGLGLLLLALYARVHAKIPQSLPA